MFKFIYNFRWFFYGWATSFVVYNILINTTNIGYTGSTLLACVAVLSLTPFAIRAGKKDAMKEIGK